MDFKIINAKVVDGANNPWFWGEVGVLGDKIVAIAQRGGLGSAKETIDAQGMVLAPGFIDIQSHSIVPLMRDGRCLGKITQGVTLEVMGEGWTPAPFGGLRQNPIPESYPVPDHWREQARTWQRFSDWLSALEGHVSPNVASFLAGGSLREYVCGMRMGSPSPAELQTMQAITAQAMQDGAFGVAYALIYPPDEYCTTAEIVAVCQSVAQHGGVYITHLRSEGDSFLEALEEAIQIGREAAIPVEVYHLKASGQRNWHKMPEALTKIRQARAKGVDITADMYPYAASGTGLDALLPTWVSAGGLFWSNLENPETRAKIRQEVLAGTGDMNTSRPENIMPVGFRQPHNLGYVGMRLSEIAAARAEDWVETVFALLLSERQRIGTIYFTMSEDNLRLQLAEPFVKISSDAGGHNPETALEAVHPRGYGTFPRVLGKYVREEGIITLESAIHKMTGMVAQRLGIPDRGRIAPQCFADLVVFDPDTVADVATFEKPHQLSVGVQHVWVNGVQVLASGQHTGALPGRFVRKP
jgi:N-acyl-D-amino-acid deacylase